MWDVDACMIQDWRIAGAIASALRIAAACAAATSRYGSMMLSRLAAPAQARAFSTSLAVRFNASRSVFDDRRNPLVGNFVPPAPAPKPVVPPKARSEPASTDFVPPPPPPPPPPAAAAESESPSASASASAEENPASSFPYTAADSSAPFNFDIAEIVAARSAAYGQSLNVGDPLLRPKIRTDAVTGRTVFIKDRLSPTSAPTPAVAIRVLERMCRDQKVRNKYHSQKFHERKGLKKKRLRSQRWRARFKTGFKAAVNKVLELKKQGW
ncbi:uncharacterized protein Triagg1_8065 [Trichoderma aggressivum f. europaeum]|uniref:Ribosomal protein S21 n=1 Tax=Trichoderma aggressivum f. europaeum TaxID=173218 RepID=A0AAE1J163_9HYPO|nr:hypothetical protein Triagg1_8065 [Trichoderma aggressivum f. europaeum]